MRLSRRSFLVMGVAGTVCACANDPNSSIDSPKENCCNDLAAIDYLSYPDHAVLKLGINGSSPAYKFLTGKSNFVGIKLGEGMKYKFLEFVTQSSGIWLPAATVFIPRFDFLDANFKEIASVEPEVFQNTGKLGHDDADDYYGAVLVPPATKYIVVYTDAAKLGTSRVQHLMADSPGATRAFRQAKAAYFQVSVEDYALNRMSKNRWWKGYTFSEHNIRRREHGEIVLRLSS